MQNQPRYISTTYTHWGFFAFCPVLFANLESDEPTVAPRWWWLRPIYALATWFLQVWIAIRFSLSANYEPMWPMLVIGPLRKPITKIHDTLD